MEKVFKLTGYIADFSRWDDLINESAVSFRKEYRVYPNILLASNDTYRKIDIYAQKHPSSIVNAGDDEPLGVSKEPYNGLECFIAADYSLEFCRDEELAPGAFTLIYDETPDFDGDPVEEETHEAPAYVYKEMA
ncbi:MAG: hypothetical protein LBQ88_00270 [Treponema sp.]|jgi:hypothetical protein|nr:hypothetical protein [Treponema sp.]